MTHGHRRDIVENTLSTIAVDKFTTLPHLLSTRKKRVTALIPVYEEAASVLEARAVAAGVCVCVCACVHV
jgi:hypothetical protein